MNSLPTYLWGVERDLARLSIASFLRDPVALAAHVAWGEDRSGQAEGMHAVLSSIGNRVADPGWWGTDLLSVMSHRAQYDCLNQRGANYARMLSVTTADPEYAIALGLAQQLVDGTLPDITRGADSYYAKGSRWPVWAQSKRYTGEWGGQLFYVVGQDGHGVAPPIPEIT